MPFFTRSGGDSIGYGALGASGARGDAEVVGHVPDAASASASSIGRAPETLGSSFAARFGRIILRDGVAALPSALFHFGGKLDLYAQHVWFISYILSHKWDEDLPYPSLGNMSNCSGVSKRQLQRYRDDLQNMGYLLVYPRRSQGRGQETNAYDFAPLFEQLEYLISDVRKGRAEGGQTNNYGQGSPGRPEVESGGNTEGSEDGSGGGWGNPVIGGSAASYREQRLDPEVGAEWERAERDPSFAARYGRVISRYGIAAVPRAIFTLGRSLRLTPQQTWFASYIFSYQWDTALPYPSITRMSANSGYTRAALQNIKSSLVSLGYLRVVQRNKADGTQDSNAYDFSALLDRISILLKPAAAVPPSVTSGESEGTSAAPATGQAPERRKSRRGASAVSKRADRLVYEGSTIVDAVDRAEARFTAGVPSTAPCDIEYAEGGDTEYAPGGDAQYADPDDIQYAEDAKCASRPPVTAGRQAPVTHTLHKVESIIEEVEKDDSSQISEILQNKEDPKQTGLPSIHALPVERSQSARRKASSIDARKRSDLSDPAAPDGLADPAGLSTSPSRYSAYIVQVASDFSYELGDGVHVLENASHAQRLWRGSGLGEEEFVRQMYEAKSRTRTAQGKHGAVGVANKMAYFFTCLKDILARL